MRALQTGATCMHAPVYTERNMLMLDAFAPDRAKREDVYLTRTVCNVHLQASTFRFCEAYPCPFSRHNKAEQKPYPKHSFPPDGPFPRCTTHSATYVHIYVNALLLVCSAYTYTSSYNAEGTRVRTTVYVRMPVYVSVCTGSVFIGLDCT